MAMVEAGHDFAFENIFQFSEIEDHSGAGIRLAGDGDFENVIVAVSMRIIAFAENALVLGGGKFRVVIKVRGGKFDFARQANHDFAEALPTGYSRPFQATFPRKCFQPDAMTSAAYNGAAKL